jgi:hypothetical protein
MPAPLLSDNDIFAIRCRAAESGDCDLSRTCSEALWGTTEQRAQAKRKLRKVVAS